MTYRRQRIRNRESGYALLMVIFMVASMLLLAAVAAPRILTEGRREKEAELVWRGKQYARAVRLFYQKNGRYPQTLEELSKPSQTGAYYLRKSYKDPVNAADGKWRLIYVSPSGQLIGSVNYLSLQDMALKLGLGIPGAGNTANPLSPQQGNTTDPSQAAAANPNSQQASAQGGATQTSQTAPPGQQQPTQAGQQGLTGQGSQTSSPFASSFGQPTPVSQLAPVDGPVVGASVIGVGSKVKQDSLQIYQGAETYSKWEFIFNSLTIANAGTAGQASGVTGGAPAGAQGAPGIGGAGTGGFGLPGSAAAGTGAPGSAPTQPPAPTQSNPQQ
jgi:hypothetical protein